MTNNKFEIFPKNQANYEPLTPLSFLPRSAMMFPDHPAVVYGQRNYSWQQLYTRCRQLASALKRVGVESGDTVAVLAANTPEMIECHFAVPMCGAVLNRPLPTY